MINRISEEILVAAGRRSSAARPVQVPGEQTGIGDQIKQWATEAEKMIASHPGASLAAALGIGIVLGWWVKRT